jgi:EmrB/QacA subfamily drug resistance transporter
MTTTRDSITGSDQPAAQAGPAGQAVGVEPYPRRWIALAVVLTASFMQLLDASVTNVAIPVIQRDLRATNAQIQLIVAAYLLAYAVLLITGGRLGDIFGRRRLFISGMIGFTIASLLCSAAQTAAQLDLARAVQGATAAFMLPQVLAVIQVAFPAGSPGRAKAFAAYGLMLGLPSLLGPFVGGGLVQSDLFGLGWRMIFLVNVPIGLVALAGAARYLPESRAGRKRMDLVGVALVSLALLLFVWPLVQGRQAGWPAWAWLALASAVPAFAAFWWWEHRLTGRRLAPLVPVTLFRNRSFTIGLLAAMTTFAAFTPLILVFTLYLQEGIGYGPLAAGAATVPFALASVITATASAGLAERMGRTMLTVGAAVLCAGTLGLVLSVRAAEVPLASGWQVAPALFVAGLGLGFIVGPLTNVILAGVPTGDAGAASGVLNTVNIVAGAVGVALLGVVFFGRLSARLPVAAGASGGAAETAGTARADAFTDAFVVSGLVTAAAFAMVLLLTLALPGRPPSSAN